MPRRSAVLAAAKLGDLATMKALITGTPDLTEDDEKWIAALHAAAKAGHKRIVACLLDAGIDVDVLDDDGLTPLCTAAENGRLAVAKILLDRDAAADGDYNSDSAPLWAAILAGHGDVAELLVSRGADIDYKPAGDALLHEIARTGDFSALKLALTFRPDLDVRDEDDRTPLHIAVIEGGDGGDPEMVWDLAQAGADVNAEDEDGYPPIHYTQHGEVEGHLQAWGAKADIANELRDLEEDLNSGEFESAANRLAELIIHSHPDRDDLWERYAQLVEETREAGVSTETLRPLRALIQEGHGRSAALWRRYARLCEAVKDDEECGLAVRRLVKLGGKNSESREIIAAYRKRTRAAEKEMQKASTRTKNHQIGRRKQTTSAAKGEPPSAQENARRAELAYDSGDWETVRDLLTESLKVQPRNVTWLSNYAMASLELGDREEYAAAMEQLRILMPQDARILSNLGVYLREKGDPRGRDYVIRAAQGRPRDPELLLNLAYLLIDEEAYDEVIKICNRIIRIAPQFWAAYDVRGGAYHEMRNYKRAEKEFRKCVEGDPDDLRFRLNLANALYGLGRLDEAIAEHTRVIEKSPDDAAAHSARALAEAHSGLADDALRDIATAKRLAGDDLVVRNYEKDVLNVLGLKEVPRRGLPKPKASAETPRRTHPRRRRK